MILNKKEALKDSPTRREAASLIREEVLENFVRWLKLNTKYKQRVKEMKKTIFCVLGILFLLPIFGRKHTARSYAAGGLVCFNFRVKQVINHHLI